MYSRALRDYAGDGGLSAAAALDRSEARPCGVRHLRLFRGAYTIEVWLFVGVYYLLAITTDSGFAEEARRRFLDYLYFSTETYTSLGFGDVRMLTDDLRLLAGIEAMIGLVLIAWTATFNYFMFEHYWVEHPRRPRHKAEDRLKRETIKPAKSKR